MFNLIAAAVLGAASPAAVEPPRPATQVRPWPIWRGASIGYAGPTYTPSHRADKLGSTRSANGHRPGLNASFRRKAAKLRRVKAARRG